ncbi:MAG: DUF3108 domain-containing protein [Burkholderiales bacterium]|nr:DUF3108 domain-containing protein [Burkholderiales bacterium]
MMLKTALIAALLAPALPAIANELPARAHIVYEARLGGFPVGQADQQWRIENGRYTLTTEVAPIIGPHIRYISHGEVSSDGLQPLDYAEFKGNDSTPKHIARFDWKHGEVQFGEPNTLTSGKLEAGAQDLNVLPFQLAWLGDKNTADVQIATGRKLREDHFGLTDPVRVNIMGKGQDTRIWRAPGNDERTEVWLAPGLANLPVRIIRSDDNRELQLIARTVEFEPDSP